jgi:hypothetical protein
MNEISTLNISIHGLDPNTLIWVCTFLENL